MKDEKMGTLQFKRVTRDVENTMFSCGVDSIDQYVKDSYYPILTQHAYAYSIMSGNTILGYYQILFREIKLEDFPEEISEYSSEVKADTISAVHIRYIAVDKKYQKNEIGTSTLRTIIKTVQDLSNNWPIRVITIDARTELVKWYTEQGFVKMESNTPGQDGVTVRMYFDCHRFTEDLQQYINDMI